MCGVLACLLGVGCADAVLPVTPSVPGRYVLETVNGGQLPALIAMVPPEAIRLSRGVLLLREDGSFLDTTIVTHDAQPFGGFSADTSVTTGGWTASDSTVTANERTFIWRGDELEQFVPRLLPLGDLTLRYVKH